jgi:hypothetical protein
MPPKQDHEEIKVQKALELLKNNPGMTRKEACHISRAAYGRVTRRLQGIRASHTRGGLVTKIIALDLKQAHLDFDRLHIVRVRRYLPPCKS